MSQDFKAVLFDLDGTLLDSKPTIKASFEHTWSVFFDSPPPLDVFMPMVGTPLLRMFEDVLTAEGHEPEPGLLADLLKEYRAHMELTEDKTLVLFEDVLPTLQKLRSFSKKTALVTSKKRDISVRHLRLFGMIPLFDAMVFEEDTLSHKPEPAPFLCGAERLGIAPADCLAVGDSPADLASAKAAGMSFAAALWGADPVHALLAANPDYGFWSVVDLLPLFRAS